MKPLLLTLVLVGGCVQATSVPIVAPSGESWIGVDCDGQSQVSCYAEAGTQCPGGYDIQDNEGHFSTEANVTVVPGFAGAHVGEAHHGSMIIKCHGKSKVELDSLKLSVPRKSEPWAEEMGH